MVAEKLLQFLSVWCCKSKWVKRKERRRSWTGRVWNIYKAHSVVQHMKKLVSLIGLNSFCTLDTVNIKRAKSHCPVFRINGLPGIGSRICQDQNLLSFTSFSITLDGFLFLSSYLASCWLVARPPPITLICGCLCQRMKARGQRLLCRVPYVFTSLDAETSTQLDSQGMGQLFKPLRSTA